MAERERRQYRSRRKFSNPGGIPDSSVVLLPVYHRRLNELLWGNALPEPLHAVRVKLNASADNGNILGHRLGEQQSVKGIFVMQFHRRKQGRVFWQDWQYFEIVNGNVSLHKQLTRLWQCILAQLDFDRDFPITRRADFDFVVRV